LARKSIVVIGASAGGVEALQKLIPSLPPDLPASVLVVLHMSPESTPSLANILGTRASITVTDAIDGEQLEHGHVYIAVPNHHLQVERGRVRVVAGPRENRHRPAIDSLFRTAAVAYGSEVIGIVLTGLLDDGSVGLALIKQAGGTTIVQDPDDAMFAPMPRNAILTSTPDFVLPLVEIPQTIVKLIVDSHAEASSEPTTGLAIMEKHPHNEHKPGEVSVYTCPECSGSLWEVKDGTVTRFECRVGHSYTLPALVEDNFETLERAMWVALRTIEESISLAKRMANRAREQGHNAVALRWDDHARSKAEDARVLRQILLRNETTSAVNE
jgi:two-component system chemotaxis response regulator CheB